MASLFLTEGVIVGLVGGLMGCALLVTAVTTLTTLQGWPLQLGWAVVALATVLGTVTGAVASPAAAVRGARLSPATALRD